VLEKADAILIGRDLFHVGQIMPKAFAKTIETLHSKTQHPLHRHRRQP
jgi:DNA repair exonuclease SbcCD nuclease subunit